MNQPVHNNAIPANPAIRAGIAAAQATEPHAPAPSSPEPVSTSQQALWDAFDPPPAPSPAEPVVPSVTPPASPPSPPELPDVNDLLAGAPAPVQTPVAPPQAPQPQEFTPAPAPQPAAPVVDYAQLQNQAIDYLMANDYRLNDEERTRLISAPDEVLPRLAARMHVGIATQLAQQVAAAVPAMIQQHLDTHVKAQRAEMEFFSRYPRLNRDEWKPTIAESLQMVKQMNPNATREQVITEGAALAAFRIQSKYGNRNQPAPPQPPRAPVQPYVPVAPGGGMLTPTNPQGQSNVWADLATDPDFNPW